MELLDFCYDILIHILEEVDAPDLGACAQTSWAFNNFIKANQRLFKTHYLKICVRRLILWFLDSFNIRRMTRAGNRPIPNQIGSAS